MNVPSNDPRLAELFAGLGDEAPAKERNATQVRLLCATDGLDVVHISSIARRALPKTFVAAEMPGCVQRLVGAECEVKDEVAYLTSQRFLANGRWEVR